MSIMETMGNGRRTRRSFSDEYKAEVIELCRTSGKSVAQVCRDLSLGETAVRQTRREASRKLRLGRHFAGRKRLWRALMLTPRPDSAQHSEGLAA